MHAKKRAPRYIAETRGNFDRHVIPAWRGRPIASITRRDVIKLLDTIADQGRPSAGDETEDPKQRRHGGPIAANRVLASISKLFNWAINRDIMETSPVTKIEKPGAEMVDLSGLPIVSARLAALRFAAASASPKFFAKSVRANQYAITLSVRPVLECYAVANGGRTARWNATL
jgi:hypothetical protein